MTHDFEPRSEIWKHHYFRSSMGLPIFNHTPALNFWMLSNYQNRLLYVNALLTLTIKIRDQDIRMRIKDFVFFYKTKLECTSWRKAGCSFKKKRISGRKTGKPCLQKPGAFKNLSTNVFWLYANFTVKVIIGHTENTLWSVPYCHIRVKTITHVITTW